jgi:flagellin-like hook-associated protein FlgL
MSSNIVLGLATRQNLLSLQQINDNMDTAQNHLSTGLKVNSAVDDAVKFFQSQSLTQRANDITQRKDQIDQGISSLTTATNAIQSVVSTLQQLQGILNSAKTQTASQRAASATQFSTIAKQLNNLVNDASYQGLNLVNSTASTLSLQFSQLSTSTMKVVGFNLLVSKLVTTHALASLLASKIVGTTFSKVSNKTSKFDAAFNTLQNAVFAAQSDAQALGGNVNFLQTRLAFSSQYIATLQNGSDKLVVADVNQESTNLVTLQTRQQLSIQSLSIATQSEQSVLRLFH